MVQGFVFIFIPDFILTVTVVNVVFRTDNTVSGHVIIFLSKDIFSTFLLTGRIFISIYLFVLSYVTVYGVCFVLIRNVFVKGFISFVVEGAFGIFFFISIMPIGRISVGMVLITFFLLVAVKVCLMTSVNVINIILLFQGGVVLDAMVVVLMPVIFKIVVIIYFLNFRLGGCILTVVILITAVVTVIVLVKKS